jgi:DNA-binding MarR family transcriptional regulator
MTTVTAERGLNTRQSNILAFVVQNPGCRSGEVGARVIAKGSESEWYATEKASRSLAQLAEKGFIVRKEVKGERRAFTYTATAKGKKEDAKSTKSTKPAKKVVAVKKAAPKPTRKKPVAA